MRVRATAEEPANYVAIGGNLAWDARGGPSGGIAWFSVVTETRRRDWSDGSWTSIADCIPCVAKGEPVAADAAALGRGSYVCVSGRLRLRRKNLGRVGEVWAPEVEVEQLDVLRKCERVSS